MWTGVVSPLAATSSQMDKVDQALEKKAADLTVDIWIYDDHFHSCKAIQVCKLHNTVNFSLAFL